jgi:hypothetical protein
VAGSNPDDPAFEEEFLADIAEVMLTGLPPVVAVRPTFHFDGPREYAAHDRAGKPWDYGAEPIDEGPADPVQILCVVEPREGESDETTLGTFDADEYIVTVVHDDEWEKIEGFTYVKMGGRRFKRSKPLVPVGLYGVTVRQFRVEADDT